MTSQRPRLIAGLAIAALCLPASAQSTENLSWTNFDEVSDANFNGTVDSFGSPIGYAVSSNGSMAGTTRGTPGHSLSFHPDYPGIDQQPMHILAALGNTPTSSFEVSLGFAPGAFDANSVLAIGNIERLGNGRETIVTLEAYHLDRRVDLSLIGADFVDMLDATAQPLDNKLDFDLISGRIGQSINESPGDSGYLLLHSLANTEIDKFVIRIDQSGRTGASTIDIVDIGVGKMVPAPGAIALLGLGGGLIATRRRR